jgi:YebC/PmpR family DNA-binding regulatory protein
MSGHNKWSKIKHKKAATDAQKSKVFSKMVRLITSEIKNAGGDANSANVRAAIEKAKAANMPNDNIARAVKKASEGSGVAMDAVTYEAYGPGGVAIIVEGLTGNRNRTAAEIKHTLSKNGLELAASGSAAWAFTKSPGGDWEATTTTEISESDGEKLTRIVDELEENEDVQEVFTNAA